MPKILLQLGALLFMQCCVGITAGSNPQHTGFLRKQLANSFLYKTVTNVCISKSACFCPHPVMVRHLWGDALDWSKTVFWSCATNVIPTLELLKASLILKWLV